MITRPRRLRKNQAIRSLVESVCLRPSDFMLPVFVVEGMDKKETIESLPGQYRWSVDRLGELLEQVKQVNLKAIMVFGIPETKDAAASENYKDSGITQQAVQQIKQHLPDVVIFTDVCLCSFTDHGHCGVVESDGMVANDATLPILQKTAISHARAGADFVAPSGMTDGMVASMRQALDQADYEHVGILSYAVKYASSFYGPFRDACASTLKGDRKTYQMNFHNDQREALLEARLDQRQGADMLMVKPGLAYIDVLQSVRQHSDIPVACYQVSGEYAMIKAAADKGWIDEQAIVMESLTAMKRAGADIILSYYAVDVCRWLKNEY